MMNEPRELSRSAFQSSNRIGQYTSSMHNMFGASVSEVYNIWCQFDLKIDNLILMISSIPLEAFLRDVRSLTVSSELPGCLMASICACLLSRLPTRKEKGKCYLKRMHASHAIRVCYLLFCVPCIFLCVCSASLRSLQLFLELLLGALARAFFGA